MGKTRSQLPANLLTYRSSLKRRPIFTVHLSGGRQAASRGTVRNTLLSFKEKLKDGVITQVNTFKTFLELSDQVLAHRYRELSVSSSVAEKKLF